MIERSNAFDEDDNDERDDGDDIDEKNEKDKMEQPIFSAEEIAKK